MWEREGWGTLAMRSPSRGLMQYCPKYPTRMGAGLAAHCSTRPRPSPAVRPYYRPQCRAALVAAGAPVTV